jgi:DNA-binding NarL/FixJ family response regulator
LGPIGLKVKYSVKWTEAVVIEILIVEDNARFRNMLRNSLQECFPFARISTAPEGDTALHKIKGKKPDLIFMDIRMPGKSGLVLTREIKQQNQDIVIVVLTNMDASEYREAAFASGADFFLSKESLKTEEIRGMVEMLTARMSTQ